MNKQQVSKLYESLSNKERARLAFSSAITGDEEAAAQISACVPRVSYHGPDIDYVDWVSGLLHLARFWGLEHWRLRCRAIAAISGAHMQIAQGNPEQAEAFLAAHWTWEECLIGLDRALDTVCNEHGIDPDTVRTSVETKTYSPLRARPDSDAKYENMAVSWLQSLLPSEKSSLHGGQGAR